MHYMSVLLRTVTDTFQVSGIFLSDGQGTAWHDDRLPRGACLITRPCCASYHDAKAMPRMVCNGYELSLSAVLPIHVAVSILREGERIRALAVDLPDPETMRRYLERDT